jgi:hypothetical protein
MPCSKNEIEVWVDFNDGKGEFISLATKENKSEQLRQIQNMNIFRYFCRKSKRLWVYKN